MTWSSHVNDSLKNCCAKLSPKRARRLLINQWQIYRCLGETLRSEI
jgi:tmRNA-binding protein